MALQVFGFFLIYMQIDRATDNQVVRLLTLLYIFLVAVNNYGKTKVKFNYKKISVLYYGFILLTILGAIRTWSLVATPQNVIYNTVLFILCSFFILTSYIYLVLRLQLDWRKVLQIAIVYPLSIFVFLNLCLWILNVKTSNYIVVEDTSAAIMLSTFGVNINRVIFPLSGGGLNTYGDLLGVLLVFAILLVSGKYVKINILIIGITIISLLLVDTRSFLIIGVLAGVIIYMINKTKAFRFLTNLPILFILGPFLMLLYLPFIYSSLSSSLLRSEESSDTFIRLLVWGQCLIKLSNFELIQIIGYGEYGHFGSGVSKSYAFLFESWKNPDYISPHNTLLSIIFDYGYIGVVMYFLVIKRSVRNAIEIWKAGHRYLAVVIISFWLYYIMSGITETLNGFYSPGIIYLFLGIFLLSELYLIKPFQISPKSI